MSELSTAERELAVLLVETLNLESVGPDEIALMEAVATTFGEVFDDPETYTGRRPSAAWIVTRWPTIVSS